MANDADKATSTTLLPPSGNMLPPSNGGSLLNLDTKGGEALAGEMARAGAEAKELAARAAAFAAEKAPEVKKKAQEAGAKVGELAGKALKEGAASAALAREALADPERRQAVIAANRKKLTIGLAAFAVVLGGGWMFAKHQANTIAKDRIDGFLIRYNLKGTVAYDDVSGSPFGSATLSGVRVTTSPSTTIKAGSLTISDIEMKGDMIQSLSVAAKSVEVPLLAMARDSRRDATLHDAIGLGYTTLTGNVDVSARFDDQKSVLSFDTSGEARDAGSWKLKLKLGGLNSGTLNALYGMSQATGGDAGLGLLAVAGMGFQALGQLTLAEASLTVDNSGYFKRSQDIPSADIPVGEGASAARALAVDETELVRGGMSPSEAQATREAVEGWMKKGGTLRIESNLTQPVALFKRGSLFSPTFDSLAEYLMLTKSKISN